MKVFWAQKVVKHYIHPLVTSRMTEQGNRSTYRSIARGARFANQPLSSLGPQELSHRPETLDIVRRAGPMRSAVILIKILVHINNQIIRRSIGVRNRGQRLRAPAADKELGRVEVGPRQQDHLRRRAGAPDGGDYFLARRRPELDVEVVRLVHDLKNDVGVVLVLCRELGPERHELVVCRPALADDAAVPAGKVVYVEHAVRAGREALLHYLVVFAKVGGVELAA